MRAQGGGGGGPALSPVLISRTVPGELRGGDVLVLSAGTLAYAGSHPSNATISTADGCRDACMALPGCNAWTFCGNGTAGCGSGCKVHSKRNPKSEKRGRLGFDSLRRVVCAAVWAATARALTPSLCHTL